jgi:predicted ATPase/class 3 adenylate cyclase
MSAPLGTVTFLFTDIEGSTRLWQADETAMRAALSRHDRLLRQTVAEHAGVVFSTMGDGIAAAFGSPSGAIGAALAAQRVLASESWPTATPIRVRMGIHTGEVELRDGDYFGTAVNRAARLMAIGHGGQVLVSSQTAGLFETNWGLVDLGEQRLRDLDRPMHVFQVGSGSFPPLRSLDPFSGNLPLQLTSFIGRGHELARGVDALRSSRVVTLTGVGGVGKTRLALQLAAEVLPAFRHGAWLVELASVRDPKVVTDAVASVFGVTGRGGQNSRDALVEFLRTKQMLVVLDNCEHVLEAAADLVTTVERACRGVVVLATSREGLALDGEQIMAVPSLGLPTGGADFDAVASSDAVTLFVQRARLVDADFALTSENASVVAAVCRRLDGVPLAIELAAARVQALTPGELAQGLDHRFQTLAGSRRGGARRHQTLRAAIDWSYDLLSLPEQRLLARLAVFVGGCNRDSAAAVCGGEPIEAAAVFGLLSTLVARSLVVAQREGSTTRYRLLETVREYAEQRLGEHDETELLRRRHRQHYAELAHLMLEETAGPGQVDALRSLRVEEDNLVAAMASAIDTGDVDVALGLLGNPIASTGLIDSLPPYPLDAIELEGASQHPLYPASLAQAALFAANRGELQTAEELAQAALDAAERLDVRTPRLDYWLSAIRGGAAQSVGALTAAAAHDQQCVDIARSAGLTNELAYSLGQVATGHLYGGDLERAMPLAAEALALARHSSPPSTLVLNLAALAGAMALSDPPQARSLVEEAERLVATFGDTRTGAIINAVVLAAAQLGDWDQALRLAPAPLRDYLWQGQRSFLGATLTVVARAAATTDPQRAARVQGAARHLMTRPLQSAATHPMPDHKTPSDPPTTPDSSGSLGLIADVYRQTSGLLRDALGEAGLRELRAEGAGMDDDRVVAIALDIITRCLDASQQ